MPRLKWTLVALDGKVDAFEEIVGLGVLVILKRRDRRAEDGGIVPCGRLRARVDR